MIATQTAVITHYGNEIEITPAAGMRFSFGFNTDVRTVRWELTPGTDYSDSSFPGCQFYAVSPYTRSQRAVNIRVTGRTIQRPGGVHSSRAVKVEIEMVGDGEPSTFERGWLFFE